MYLLSPDEAPNAGLRRIILEKIEESIDLLNRPVMDAGTVIHEVRKNVKRVRAAQRLARYGIGETEYNLENLRLRDLARTLASARDANVLKSTLARVLLAADRTAEDIEGITAVLFSRDPNDPANGTAPDGGLFEPLIAGFRTAEGQVRKFVADPDAGDFVYRGLVQTARCARAEYREIYSPQASAENFHEWRKQVKYLWHQFEILASVGRNDNKVLKEDLEHLSEQLGLAHDSANLHAWLQTSPARSQIEDGAALIRRVNRDRRDHEGAARIHGEVLFEREPEELLAWYGGAD
ncbi:MAG TPA: CHAD domain-containing protein [Anaerolineales bacterium]|nr:CHAD domain-containing protein [Anaerolineales bacterium]